jgi:hypothetical protein
MNAQSGLFMAGQPLADRQLLRLLARPAALAPLGEDVAGDWWRSDAGEKIMEAACRWLLQRK